MAGSKAYDMDGIEWYRCPGAITFDQHKAASASGLLSGCFLYIGLKDVTWHVGGRVHCAHCGGHAERVSHREVGELPRGTTGANPAVYVAARMPAADLKGIESDRYDWACCFNKSCSKHYLEANAVDSDAVTTSVAIGTGGRVHSATQFAMLKRDELPPDLDAGDRWKISSRAVNRQDGKSWRRCLFCGVLFATSEKETWVEGKVGGWPLKSHRAQRRHEEPEDEQGWNFWGPAATFRLYRWEEYVALLKGATEPVVAVKEKP